MIGLRDFTLSDVIERNAQIHGDRPAFVANGRHVSHREYASRVAQLAAGLAHAGLGAGDRVAVVANNCIEYVDLYGAAARLGLIVVAVNTRLSSEEIAYVIADTTPKAIVVGEEFRGTIEADRGAWPFVERCIGLGKPGEGYLPFDEVARTVPSTAAPHSEISHDAGFLILHTAAVGGRPRGALLSQANIIAANTQLLDAWKLSEADVCLAATPMFHVAALGLMLAVQQAGGATVVLPQFEAPAALDAIARERVSVLAEFPPMLAILLDAAAQTGADLGSLRHVGGVDSPDTIARFESACPSARFWSWYGQSETSGVITVAPYRDRPGSAGLPTRLARLRIVDDLDRPLPSGQAGEIVVRGPMVFQGYWNCAADNDVTFHHGWHHTGDMGRLDADGYLWYVGRSPAKELIKPGGENVYPAEVEQTLLQHPAIAEAVVFGVPDAHWGEAVKAVCVCRAGVTVEVAELIEFVGIRIARYKKPRHVVFTISLPKNAQGTVDRARVKQDYAQG